MQPKHSRTDHFLKQRLFQDLQSFSQLESRISGLETNIDRGDAFEVFAQGYLATQKIVQAKEVWPFDKIPEKVKRSIAIGTPKDMGVDGVFETAIGEHAAYQVKFRTGRPSLTWDELSTFMGLTEQASERVLFTNCDDLPALMNDRERFFCIRGNDLDRLEARDFEIIRDWLQKGFFTPVRKTPLPHQEEALQAVQSVLGGADRATLVMACGTGKTLVALWAAERLGAKSVLVLVPSLALVRQTLHEWLKETSWPDFSFLCVCSDPTVTKGGDEVVVRQSDLDFPVTTESRIVRDYLSSAYDGVRVVFSTYQSARVVSEGMADEPFDLGLFDEAHKTAGRQGTRFSFALTDENLSISKRLFMTATPRHYDVRKKDKEGDAKLVYSMDVPEIYGDRIHELSFREAAARDLICDYKVVISVVTTEDVNDELLRRGEVVKQGEAVKARQVANQVALLRAVEKYGIQRIFTFHSSVKSAKSFTGPGGAGVNSELPDFLALHVNGAMPTANREHVMQEFAEADKAVISNARCLTEGVDLPAVDMVAFMAPKKSKVDIVQATGRAMRKAPNKVAGYVMVPLFVEQETGETVEDSLERTGFDEVWNVLEAMKEQDDVLEDIIRQMRVEYGRVGGYDDTRFREHVEVLGPEVSLSSLREAVIAICVERLGVTWDERYGQLVTFKEQFGHCTVPRSWKESPKLGTWCTKQRVRKKEGNLTPERIQRLESLGFVWDPLEALWEESFAALAAYRERFGHCNVSQSWKENPKLGKWCNQQRLGKQKGTLSLERIQRLESLGFVWDPHEASWEESFAALEAYKAQFGHCNVPRGWKESPALGTWCGRQRQTKKQGNLMAERIQRLESLGFVWDPREALWEESFAALAAFKKRFGHCDVPQSWEEDPTLGTWCNAQRERMKKGAISLERIQRLESLGFVWDALEVSWEESFAALAAYKEQFGHCNVPVSWKEDPTLGSWCDRQRQTKKRGKLTPERAQRLESLGFVWDPQEALWEESFAALAAFKKRFGHCNVPSRWKEAPKLAGWVGTQRQRNKKGTLSPEQTQKLESLGFIWDPYEASWEEGFAALEAYKQRFGHCNVPSAWKENPKLGTWCTVQRRTKKHGNLTSEREQRLKSLGFVWDPQEALWEESFAALKAYKKRFGDCDVPQAWKENPALGRWCHRQRQAKKKGTLSRKQIERLESLGFVWDPFEASWEEGFAALAAFKEQVGHCNVPQLREEDSTLGRWCSRQRQTKRQGNLTAERIRRLESLGFVWDPHEALWEESFAALKAYKAQFGHCDVPRAWKESPKLATWCNNQRGRKKRGTLSLEQIQRLESLGFVWDTYEASWEESFAALKVYKERVGHCNVPLSWKEDPTLATWCDTQRQTKKRGKLTPGRIQRLESLGFVWDPREASWEENFAALAAFKKRFGHCNVPQSWKEDPKLACWVGTQRAQRRKLSQDRIQRLEALGFAWTGR